ncbi:hypothetical protein [Flavobacterium litorale]|uniref:Uncharacterized protein n=1 Tax=Flavobacterium litorale TaxID=2856519 RepID=A0ABX8VBI2_9FLAO|nr:hypothetical protein [Flavobacterium litorale]QYJ68019.1 hypothetical protein K1I41_10850 [Flavobacterium litorale]
MNFTVQLSDNNTILLTDKNGNTKETLYNSISHFGDNYSLAKKDGTAFYVVLDLEGNLVNEEIKVIHRFDNGLLLTYSNYSKDYKSSDNYRYAVNYNIYSIYNYETKKSHVVSIVQSDPIEDDSDTNGGPNVETIKNFNNKTIYTFNDLVFSEIIAEKYMIVGSHFDLLSKKTSKNYAAILFQQFEEKRMWNIMNIDNAMPYGGETALDYMVSGRIFKGIEHTLYTLIAAPETDIASIVYEEEVTKAPARKAFTPVKSIRKSIWKKKSKWQIMFTDLVDFSFN